LRYRIHILLIPRNSVPTRVESLDIGPEFAI